MQIQIEPIFFKKKYTIPPCVTLIKLKHRSKCLTFAITATSKKCKPIYYSVREKSGNCLKHVLRPDSDSIQKYGHNLINHGLEPEEEKKPALNHLSKAHTALAVHYIISFFLNRQNITSENSSVFAVMHIIKYLRNLLLKVTYRTSIQGCNPIKEISL